MLTPKYISISSFLLLFCYSRGKMGLDVYLGHYFISKISSCQFFFLEIFKFVVVAQKNSLEIVEFLGGCIVFWEIFIQLCNERKTKPNPVAKEIGIPSGSITNWKNGMIPRSTTLQKLADYFGVTPDYLLGKTQQSSDPPVAEGKERVTIQHRDGRISFADFSPEQIQLIESMIAAQKKEKQ